MPSSVVYTAQFYNKNVNLANSLRLHLIGAKTARAPEKRLEGGRSVPPTLRQRLKSRVKMGSISIRPKLLYWACERAGYDRGLIKKYFPSVSNWRQEEIALPVGKLRDFARKTYTTIHSLALDEPLEEVFPFTDFRTFSGRAPKRPSPNLLDMAWICLMRQEWYRDYAKAHGEKRRSFVGSADLRHSSARVAQKMGARLNFTVGQRAGLSQSKVFGRLVAEAERVGILVVVNSCVGYNTSRPLDSREFRGFALPDEHAPLVFVNSADAAAARLFTLAHELAHVWLGEPAISNLDPENSRSAHARERWCNAVAAELLVPGDILERECAAIRNVEDDKAVQRLARKFKVSQQVILIRLRDSEKITPAWFRRAYDAQMRLIKSRQQKQRESSGGPSIVETVAYKSSRRFAKAIIGSAAKRETRYADAMNLLGVNRIVYDRIERKFAD